MNCRGDDTASMRFDVKTRLLEKPQSPNAAFGREKAGKPFGKIAIKLHQPCSM